MAFVLKEGERYFFRETDGLSGEGVITKLDPDAPNVLLRVKSVRACSGFEPKKYIGLEWSVPKEKLEPSGTKQSIYPPYRAHESMRMDIQPVSRAEEKDYPDLFPRARVDALAETDPASAPSEHQRRKSQPLFRGLLAYFPDALAAVSHVSLVGNEQHHPGAPLHWEKEKSIDHEDCLLRHLTDRGSPDSDGLSHTAKVAWRALALLQTELEAEDEGLRTKRQAQRNRAKEGKR